MGTAVQMKPKTHEQKATRTVMDTILVTPEIVQKWKAPPFQRPVKENAKVLMLAEELKHQGGVWPGVVTLGVFSGDTYIIDGQHRGAAFLLSGLAEGYTDVRIHYMESMGEMGHEFVKLNSQLSRMAPDDILRGLEPILPALQLIHSRAPFVGYDSIRRNPANGPIVSMSVCVRCWRFSSSEIPRTSGYSSQTVAETIPVDDAEKLCDFLDIAMAAFGRDPEYYRMWGALNLTVNMWLYRRLVLTPAGPTHKHTKFNRSLFQKCLMGLTVDSSYLDWLTGRILCERDRAPAYNRIKSVFAKRIHQELGVKAMLPQPAWSNN